LTRFDLKPVVNGSGLHVWQSRTQGSDITLIQSGIGFANAVKAAAVAAELLPQLIISAGFCGGLSPAATLGKLFIADKLYHYRAGTVSGEVEPSAVFTAKIGAVLKKGTFITTDRIVGKAEISSLLPDPTEINLLEMESSSIAEVCRNQGIEFVAIRSVSDPPDSDPAPLFRAVCNKDFKISMAKTAFTIIKRPFSLPEFFRMAANAAVAGKSLADGLALALERI
jgi:adenosylhomocysteine nucleosidase